MARDARNEAEEEGGEFADFLADVSKEIATPAAAPKKKTPIAADAGVIVEWPNVADRMIEDIR